MTTRGTTIVAVTSLALLLGGCTPDGSGGSSAASGNAATDTAASENPASTSATAPAEATDVPSSDGPFGAGCAALPAQGEGSVAGMADDPVATAAVNNPLLSRLGTAVRAANLVDSLNAQQDITVLAPVNPAFEALPPQNLAALVADTPQLTAVLTHHVIQGRLTPDRLAGTHTTLNNDEITLVPEAGTFAVAASGTLLGRAPARIVCGNLSTANASLYIIDQVLAPPA